MPAHRIPTPEERFSRFFERLINEKNPTRRARLDHALHVLANWNLLFPSTQ